MSSRFLLHLLGFWLLLSQPCRARVTEEWMDQVIQVCGRGYARAVFEICGTSVGRLALSQGEPALPQHRPRTETMPSFINKDAEPLDSVFKCLPNLSQEPKAALSEGQPSLPELQQYAPASRDSVGSLKDFKKSFHNPQGAAEDSHPPEPKHSHLDPPSRKKRQSASWLSERCCYVGCARRSIAQLC